MVSTFWGFGIYQHPVGLLWALCLNCNSGGKETGGYERNRTQDSPSSPGFCLCFPSILHHTLNPGLPFGASFLPR
jgi:hypothetical protein